VACGASLSPNWPYPGSEWSSDNLRQLIDTADGGIDYIFTGALRIAAEERQLLLRVWEVKKLRERKTFSARWTVATADAELAKLHEQVRTFMEWKPGGGGLTYAAPAQPRAWLDVLAASLRTFLGEKNILPAEQIGLSVEMLAHAAQHAATSEAASLAWLTLRARAVKLGVAVPTGPAMFVSPLIDQAASLLA
jgi:hypothetical protein